MDSLLPYFLIGMVGGAIAGWVLVFSVLALTMKLQERGFFRRLRYRLKFKRGRAECRRCGGKGEYPATTGYSPGPPYMAPCALCKRKGYEKKIAHRFRLLEPEDDVDKEIELRDAENVLGRS